MGWGIIYYNSPFFKVFENLVESGVVFPLSFHYFKTEKLNFKQILKFLENRAE